MVRSRMIWVITLGFYCPVHELKPILASMLDAESMHSPRCFILLLDCCVGVAHEGLPYKVDTMSNMWQRYHFRQLAFIELLTCNGIIVHFPVSLADCILQR